MGYTNTIMNFQIHTAKKHHAKYQHIWSQLLVGIIVIMALPSAYSSPNESTTSLNITQIVQIKLIEQINEQKITKIAKQQLSPHNNLTPNFVWLATSNEHSRAPYAIRAGPFANNIIL